MEDLITLYAEDLCSEDSKKLVEEHIKNCENCQKKLAAYKKSLAEELYQDDKIAKSRKVQNEQIPDDIQPFQKIKNIMWYRWVGMVVLAVVLAVVVSVTGWLSYTQITKEPGESSFETFVDGFSAKKLCKKFADGDIEGFIDGLYITIENCESTDLSAFLDVQKENLKNFYNERLKNKNMTVHVEETGYAETSTEDSSQKNISSCVQMAVEIEEDYTLYLILQKIGSNQFAINSIWHETDKEETETDNYLELSSILETFIINDGSPKVTSTYEKTIVHSMRNLEKFTEKQKFPNYFLKEEEDLLTVNTEYNAEIQRRLNTLLKENITIIDCTFQSKIYDTKRNMFYSYDEDKQAFITMMYLIVKDAETGNTGILIREFEKTDIGLKMTETETKVFGTLDEDIMEQLEHLFD